ncbi:MAG: ribonuclease HII [Fretibacterium sp.]|nr:ribonuclease HII [Fretibacterium sp.]
MEQLRRTGFVAGTDEAGRGPLAGPVMAAAVCLTPEQERALLALGLRDSKLMTPRSREAVFQAMRDLGVLWRAQAGSVARIERDNILQASLWAMRRSVLRLAELLPSELACVVVDGTMPLPELEVKQWPLISADALIPSVSAASVVAKVLRDRLMTSLDALYPGYGLAQNKGYPTAAHREAVRQLGLSPIHRRSFCKKLLLRGEDIDSLPLFP